MGVGRYVSATRKITESILFSEKSRKLNACANSVYQAFSPTPGYEATIVADRQAWQLFTKTFPDNSLFDSVYQRALETFVLSFFSIETLTTALVQAF